MYGYLLKFNSIPQTGFALHCKIPRYYQNFTPEQEGIEIVYIKSGTIIVEYLNNEWTALPGSILVLQRNLPFKLYTKNNETNEHSTIQLLTDFKIEVIQNLDSSTISDTDSLAIPFILQPCSANEEIVKKMNAVISDVGDVASGNRMSHGLVLASVLYDINQIWKSQKKVNEKSPSILCYKIKKILSEHIEDDISLEFIAKQIGKTPNYLNYVFKEETGMTIHSHLIKEKVRIICELILSRALSFKDSCQAVGINDVSYGYRMFKKQTGLTPGEFAKSETYEKYKGKRKGSKL